MSPDLEAVAAASRTVRTHGVNFTLQQRAADQAYGAPILGKDIHQFAYCKVTAVMDGYVDRSASEDGGSNSGNNGNRGRGAGEEEARGGRGVAGQQEHRNGVGKESKRAFRLQPYQFPLYDGLSWTVDLAKGWRVASAQLRHRVPCWGYVFLVRFFFQVSPRAVVDVCQL